MNPDRLTSRIRWILLCLLAFVLPLFEAPKNILIVLLILLSLADGILRRPFRGRWPDPLEWALIGLLAASVISTALNWPSVGTLKGVKDTVLTVSTGWIAYRHRWSAKSAAVLALMLALGVVVGLIWGAVEVLQGRRMFLELNSVGVVTQSSMYLAMVLVVVFGVAYTQPSAPAFMHKRNWWWSATGFLLIGLFAMASRGTLLAVGCLYLAFLMLRLDFKLLLAGLLMAATAAGTAYMLPDKFDQKRYLEKSRQLLTKRGLDDNDGLRFGMWRIGLARFGQGDQKLFGIGPRNFPTIELNKLKFDPPLVIIDAGLKHAHNIFITKLVEEGVFGLAALLFLFCQPACRLVRDWRSGGWRDWRWFGAAGALAVPVIAGSFNTPWYHEHALLAMILFGLYLSPGQAGRQGEPPRPRRKRRIDSPPNVAGRSAC